MYIIVMGGGQVGYHLTRTLMQKGHEVLLVEKDHRRALLINEELGPVVFEGDGCEFRTLQQIGTSRADVVVAVTGDDEDNLVACQISKRNFGVRRTIARVNDPRNEDIFRRLGIDETVSSTKVIDDLIEQEIATGDVVPLAALQRGDLEIVEASIREGSPAARRAVRDLELPAESLISCIVRGGRAVVPQGDTILQPDDRVIALVHRDQEAALQTVLRGPTPT
ncbi:MAG: TrkA family potassium uptake protein [Armatimonadetes bacterium]|jgi:trk system potassium uptake protein TrkA|nr:TrkA family potassium uptake protein [Armatimonadota bacterium]